MKEKILDEIIKDLSDNYRNDKEVLTSLLDDIINDALFISNRRFKTDKEEQLTILKSNIKKAVKSVYLQRGSEDVSSNSESGTSNTYEQVVEVMTLDIIRQNKRIMI